MNKPSMIAISSIVVSLFATATNAAESITLQLKWVTQAQFAGYYVAQAKGYYKRAGLDVTINPGGPDVARHRLLREAAPILLLSRCRRHWQREKRAVPLVNISQTFKKSGLEITCRADTSIKKPTDLIGKTVGVWFFGNEYPFRAFMSKFKIKTDGSRDSVKMLKQGFNVDPLIQRQADCISTMTYNEYWSVIDAGFRPSELTVFKYSDYGIDTLEDGLYVLESRLSDGGFVARSAKFLKASIEGWDFAKKNIDEATEIVLSADTSGVQTKRHQRRMLQEIIKLLDPADGKLEPADYERTVSILLAGGSSQLSPRNRLAHGLTGSTTQ